MARYTDDEKAMYVALVCRSMKDGMTGRKAAALHGVTISQIWDWCEETPDYKVQYDAAREALMQHWEEDLVEIADTQHEGTIRKQKLLGDEIETRDMIQHRTLRVQTRQWLLSKLKPKRYGDKMQLGGADDLPPIRSKADVNLTPEDAYKQMIGIGGNGRS